MRGIAFVEDLVSLLLIALVKQHDSCSRLHNQTNSALTKIDWAKSDINIKSPPSTLTKVNCIIQLEVFPSAKIDMDIHASAYFICLVHPSEEAIWPVRLQIQSHCHFSKTPNPDD